MTDKFSRRNFLSLGTGAAVASLLAACDSTSSAQMRRARYKAEKLAELSRYAAFEDGGFSVPAIPGARIDRMYWRQIVDDPFGEIPGTVVIDTPDRFLYLTLPERKALRVGVGVGRIGFEWSGRATIAHKRHWPTWTPPAEMIARVPELEKWAQGMPGGLGNPLGARALYIHMNGRDTLYRVHGSPEWWSIGTAASSGCIRLTNHDIVDVYDRIPVGSPIVVIPDNRQWTGDGA